MGKKIYNNFSIFSFLSVTFSAFIWKLRNNI